MKKVSKIIAAVINKNIQNSSQTFIQELQNYKADIMGFNRLIYNKRHNLNKKWTDYEYVINVETHINKKGLILK